MHNLGINNGCIVTLNQNDIFVENDLKIRMIPVDEYLSGGQD